MITIGSVIKQARSTQKMTQKDLAAGICAQSMISAIENGRYAPNATLLLSLARRLHLDLNQFSLATHYPISGVATLNATCERLCRAHRYADLASFLQTEAVLAQLETKTQLQAYYYYLAVTRYQTGALAAAKTALKLALVEAPKQSKDTLTRLCLMVQALVSIELGAKPTALQNLKHALKGLEQLSYVENQNVLYYLGSLVYFKMGAQMTAVQLLSKGITFIADHDSHYLLANCYFLLARLSDQPMAATATTRSAIFEALYHEKIYKDF